MENKIIDLIKEIRKEGYLLDSLKSFIEVDEYITKMNKIHTMVNQLVSLAENDEMLVYYLDMINNHIDKEEYEKCVEIKNIIDKRK